VDTQGASRGSIQEEWQTVRLFHLGQRLSKRDNMALIRHTQSQKRVVDLGDAENGIDVQEKEAVRIFKKLCTLIVSQHQGVD